MTSDLSGFPSRVADDPIFKLVIRSSALFESAEERRLFYVMLTGARTTMTLYAPLQRVLFIIELIQDHDLKCKILIGQRAAFPPIPDSEF